jgi:phosphatidylserine decarboxylase
MIIHKDCYGTILLVWLICAPLAYLILKFIPWNWLAYLLATVPMFMMGFVLFFFRVPKRTIVGKSNEVTSVADGRVVIIDKVYEPEFIKGECMQISVYMNFFNVHVNYWPVAGEATYYKYHPGKYLFAYLPKASELNEHTSIGMKSAYGDVFYKQIAGTFARRIVFNGAPGDKVEKGQECGIIKFGSRIDMYLPLDADIKVELGQCVRACETVLAELHK